MIFSVAFCILRQKAIFFAKFKIRRCLPCGSHGFAAPAAEQGHFGLNEREVLLSMATSKKQVLKRLLSLTLAVVMCFGFIPIHPKAASTPATLTNGEPVTVENVLALIEEYKNGTREPGEKAKEAGFTSYADYSEYDPYNPPYYIAGLGSGTECAKFAFAFWDDIFGDVPYCKVSDSWQVRPGDLVHTSSHWFIVVSNPFSSQFYTDPCVVTVGGGKAGAIGWADSSGTPLGDTVLDIYTRYPE